jgi:hypothetical protein
MGMHLAQRKISEDKRQMLPKVLLKTLDNRISLPTCWALVIAVFHEDAYRIFLTLFVILGIDWNG